ncbi:MAG TPA: hypothetical protein VFC51_19815 [Chloroflexota bacterium]|nr:hypothetical protein [Chloroflexota bacterium]
MDPKREQLFALGVAVGTALGFVLGSLVALRLGDDAVDALRRTIERIAGHEERPKFEYLLQ